MNFMEKLLKYSTYLLVFLTPLLYSNDRIFPYVTSKTFFFYGIVEILTVICIYFMMQNPLYRLNKIQWKFLIPIFLYIGWMTLAGIFAFNPSLSFWSSLSRGTGLLTLYHGLAFSIIIISLSNKYGARSYLRDLLYFVITSSFITGLTIWFGDEGFNLPINMLKSSNGGGQLGNSSLAAAYLLLTLGFTAFLFFAKDVSKKIKYWLVGGFSLIFFSPLFFSLQGLFNGRGFLGTARGATIAIVVAFVLSYFIYLIFSKKTISKIIGFTGTGIGIVLFIIFSIKLFIPGTFVNQEFVKATSGTRLIFWDIADKSIKERPLIGYGPENFPIAVQNHFNPSLLDKSFNFEAWTDRAHNLYYDTGVAGGYPAIFLYILFFVSLIYASFLSYKNEIFSREQFSIMFGLIIAYLLQDLLVFDSIVSLITLFVFAGFIFASLETKVLKNGNTIYINKNLIIIATFVLSIFLVFGLYNFYYMPIKKAKLFAEILGAKIDKKIDRYPELIKGSVVGNDWDVSGFAHDEYKFYASNPVATKQDKKILPYAKKDVLSFINYLEEITKTNKTDYRLYLSIVHLYSTYIFLSDLPYDANLANHILEYATYAKKLNPNDPQIYWSFGQISAWKGDVQGLINYYKEAIAVKPSLPAPHKLLIGILQSLGDRRSYEEALIQAQKDVPNFSMDK